MASRVKGNQKRPGSDRSADNVLERIHDYMAHGKLCPNEYLRSIGSATISASVLKSHPIISDLPHFFPVFSGVLRSHSIILGDTISHSIHIMRLYIENSISSDFLQHATIL